MLSKKEYTKIWNEWNEIAIKSGKYNESGKTNYSDEQLDRILDEKAYKMGLITDKNGIILPPEIVFKSKTKNIPDWMSID